MRTAFVAVFALAITIMLPIDRGQADPYRWYAEYGGGRGGGTNCYFVTLEQCRATVSGNGGFCRQNGFYDGRPVTPEAQSRRSQYRVRSLTLNEVSQGRSVTPIPSPLLASHSAADEAAPLDTTHWLLYFLGA